MKKALAMLLLAGLAFLPLASFADVVDESLGQGSGFAAALNTGSSDLVQIFPQKAEDFASAVFYRYGVPDYAYNNINAPWGNDGGQYYQFPIFGADNWMGIIDKKLGIGTIGVYTNVPVNYFTDDAGGHPDLGMYYYTNDQDWHHIGNYGIVTNDWGSVIQAWHTYQSPLATTSPVGSTNPSESMGLLWGVPTTLPLPGGVDLYLASPVYIQTPQNKVEVVYADQGFGLSLNYGDNTGSNVTDFNSNSFSSTNPVAADTFLGYSRVADSAMEFGGSVGYGTKDTGVFSTFDVSGSFELGMLDQSIKGIQENPAANGSNTMFNMSHKDGNGGIYDVRLNLLATKDTDEMTQVRLSANGVLSKLGEETMIQMDGNNDGNFNDTDDLQAKRDFSYDNLNIGINAGVVHKIEGGNGRVVASIGANYRDQTFKDQVMFYDAVNSRWEYPGDDCYSNADFTSLVVPIRVGVEQSLTGWLTLRLGASTNAFQYYWAKEMAKNNLNTDATGFTDSSTINTSSDSFQNVAFDTGFGIVLGNFTFDALLDQEWVEDTLLVHPASGILTGNDIADCAKFQATFKY